MPSIITNFTAPSNYNELMYFYNNGRQSNINLIFTDVGSTTWSVAKSSKIGDLVFFHCAKTSVTKIAHARVEAKASGNEELIAFANEQYALYKACAGKILAMGVVASDPFPEDGMIYADISEFHALSEPVPYSSFKSFIKLNPAGAITGLSGEQEEKLLELIDHKDFQDLTEVVVSDPSFSEGARIEVYGTKYERNPKVRAAFLAGVSKPYKCEVCGFDFEAVYGDLGKEYIEVHHKEPLYLNGKERQINPTTDLVCLCSNCHRMIHRKGIMSVEELKKVIKK